MKENQMAVPYRVKQRTFCFIYDLKLDESSRKRMGSVTQFIRELKLSENNGSSDEHCPARKLIEKTTISQLDTII